MINIDELLKNECFYNETKKEILYLYGVVKSENFDVKSACEKRISYLESFMLETNRLGFTLGISGGVDSTLAGKLASIACKNLQKKGFNANFYAVRLPAGIQKDEEDAQKALDFIKPEKTITINIGETADILNQTCYKSLVKEGVITNEIKAEEIDYHKGNVKARLRMAAQYYVASITKTCVIGTDHSGEAIAGFWTTGGDNVCDLLVLNGLNKRQVRLCAKYLGAPENLWNKLPTADLEELNPGKLDDIGFGYSYEEQNDFLEGKEISKETEYLILKQYLKTDFKRNGVRLFGNKKQ